MQFKTLIIAGAAALTLGLAGTAAEAKTKVIIDLGLGHPGYCNPRYEYCGGYGYDNGYGYDSGIYLKRHDRVIDPYRMTCKQARWMLDDRGYNNIKTQSCGGKYHVFKARKHGDKVLVKVRALTGRIVSVRGI